MTQHRRYDAIIEKLRNKKKQKTRIILAHSGWNINIRLCLPIIGKMINNTSSTYFILGRQYSNISTQEMWILERKVAVFVVFLQYLFSYF